VVQVWFQNRRAKFRRNERSILAQRTQLQQFAAASISRKCASLSPSQLIDDFHHRQLHRQQQQQQQLVMVESSASPVGSVSQSVSSSTSWQAAGLLPLSPHYVQSAGRTSAVDVLYSGSSPAVAPGVVPLSAGAYNASATDSSVLHQRHSVTSAINDDHLQSTAAAVPQRITEFTTAYMTQTTTTFI